MAKSSAPQTPAELLALLAKSGLTNPQQQQVAETRAAGHGDVKEAARELVRDKLLTPWQASQLLAGQFVLRLGDYALQNEAGLWEFGRAFTAEQLRTGRRVGLGLVANRFVQDEASWKACLAEIQTAGQLNHPHLAAFVEVGRSAQRSFVIGPTFDDDVRQLLTRYGAPSADQIARMLGQAAAGLVALHAAGVAHGCLQPQRIGLAADGSVQLRDVGLARLAKLLHAEAIPEQGREEHERFAPPAETSPMRGDVYTLGRIGQYLLEAGAVSPQDASEVPPTWWRQSAPPSADAVVRLRELLHRLTALDDTAAPRDAAEAAAWLRGWQVEWSDALPELAAEAASAPEPGAAVPVTVAAAAEGDAEAAAGVVTPAATVPAAAAPAGPIVIDTHRRRRSATAEDAMPRTRPRQRGLLFASSGLLALILLLLGSFGVWKWYGGEAARPIAAVGPNDDVRARLNAAGLRTAPVEDAAEAALPTGEDLEFPTAEAFPSDAPPAAAPPPELGTTSSVPMTTEAAGATPVDVATASGEGPPAAAGEAMPAEAAAPQPAAPTAEPAPSDTAAVEPPSPPAAVPTIPPPADTAAAPPPASAPASAPTDMLASALASIPAAVNLPDSTQAASTAASLFPLPLDDSAIVTLQLAGGDKVTRTGDALQIENAAGGTAERTWDVLVVDSSAQRTAVAQFELAGQELLFRWLDKAADSPAAGQLSNCALRLAIGTEQRDVGLRLPIEVEPLPIDLVRGITTGKWEIPNAPDAAECRLEILGLAGQPNPVLRVPDDSIPVSGSQWLLLGEKPTTAILGVHLESQFRRQLEVAVTATLPPDEKLLDKTVPPRAVKQFVGQRDNRITKANLDRWAKQATAELAQATQRVEVLTRQSQAGGADPAQAQDLARNLNLANQDLERAKAQSEMLSKILAIANPTSPPPALLLRVVFESAGSQVELLRTRQP